MKTLDEVIDWYENRKGVLIGKAAMEEMEDSILHYLREYRIILPLVPSLINTAIAVQKKGNKYRKMETDNGTSQKLRNTSQYFANYLPEMSFGICDIR